MVSCMSKIDRRTVTAGYIEARTAATARLVARVASRKRKLPPVSRIPERRASELARREGKPCRRKKRMTRPNARAATFTKTSGVKRAAASTWAIKTKNPPKPAPATMPRVTPGRLEPFLSGDRLLTSQMPVRPSRIPARSPGLGRLSNSDPARTGRAAPTTAEVGATVAAAPVDSPWYSAAIPTAPETPAASDQAIVRPDGKDSPARTAAGIRTLSPARAERATTLNWDARRAATPPTKSPVPQTNADARPEMIPKRLAGIIFFASARAEGSPCRHVGPGRVGKAARKAS